MNVMNKVKYFFKNAWLETKDFFIRTGRKIKRSFKRNPNKIRESKLDLALNITNIVCLILGVLIIIFPLLN
ncbi:MAG: hypothetical protein K2J11_02970, partial [Oscillospiraceae bacterium]|nr:hypothetical protein [Oscillospiraceae bacterium]